MFYLFELPGNNNLGFNMKTDVIFAHLVRILRAFIHIKY